MKTVERNRTRSLLSVALSTVLVLGLSPLFSPALARADESTEAPPTPEDAPSVASDGTATMPDGSLGDPADAIDMYRLYNSDSGEHIFTSDHIEIEALLADGWHDENIGWMAPSISNMPVYRLYNPYTNEHLFTSDANEYTALLGHGWHGEGTAFYSADESGVPIYRLFNPYGSGVTAHHYATDTAERDGLVALGWLAEGAGAGAAFYGMTTDPIDDHDVELQDDVKYVDVEEWGENTIDDSRPPIGSAPDDEAGVSGATSQFVLSAAEAADVAVDDVIVGLPDEENDTGAAMKVTALDPVEGGYLVTDTVPELEELIDYVDVSGTALESDADIDYEPGVMPLTTADDGSGAMTLSIDPSTIAAGDGDGGEGEDDFQGPLGRDYDFNLGRGVTLTFNPDLHYDFKYGWFSVRKAQITASLDTTLRLVDFSLDKEFSKKLFSYNFTVPQTFGAVVVQASFTLVADAHGSATVVATSRLEQGFNYEKGKFNWVNKNTKPEMRASFEGSAHGGVRPEVMLKIFGVNTAYLGIEGGLGVDAVLEASNTSPDPIYCDITAYLFADLFLNKEKNAAGKLFETLRIPTTVTLMDKSTSPIWTFHVPL